MHDHTDPILTPQRPLEEDPFESMLKKKSGTLPPEGKFKAVEKYICKTNELIDGLKPLPLSYSNITPRELCALRGLQQRSDIVIKPADKGGSNLVQGPLHIGGDPSTGQYDSL